MNVVLECEYCGSLVTKILAQWERGSGHVFCNRTCSGMSRRKGKTADQKKAEKAKYDRAYRAENRDRLKALKAEYFQRTYDPAKAAEKRKRNMPRHIAYCRQPRYREWKRDYDRSYRSKKYFGVFAESHLLLLQIESEVAKRMSDYEIRLQQGTLNKAQNRKRALYEKTHR